MTRQGGQVSESEYVGGQDSDDSVQQFAKDLSRLRLQAENPTLARLQTETGISRTVLSEAFSGAKLPTARTVDGIVRACGDDPGPWLDRRDALATRGKEPNGTETPSSPGSSTPAVSRRAAVLLATGTFLAGVAASAVTTTLIVSNATAASPNAAQITVSNGLDPAMTECVDDARVATGDTRADNSLLEIVWSDKCQAGWGRITRYEGLGQDNTVTIAIYPETAPDGPDRQEATEHDVQGAYTTLVVRPSPDTLLCAEGNFTVDGKRIDLGDPLCI